MEKICKEEINYFILARALFYVASVLEQYTEKGFRRLHDRIKQKLWHLETCQKRCSEKNGNDHKKWCPTCQQWRIELAKSHSNKSLDWSKSRSWEWPRDFKTIAPLFAKEGALRKPAVINFTDLSTALYLWENCVEFSIAQNVIMKLRELRNGCFAHPPKMEVTDQKLASSFNVINVLLHETDLQNFVDRDGCLLELDDIRKSTEIDWVVVKQTLKEVQNNLGNQLSDKGEIISSLQQVQFNLQAQNETLKTQFQEQEAHLLEIKEKVSNREKWRCLKWMGMCVGFVVVISLLIWQISITRDHIEKENSEPSFACSSKPFEDVGNCSHVSECHCPQIYTGERCETLLNDTGTRQSQKQDYCESRPCLNGFFCTSHVNGYGCQYKEKQLEHEKVSAPKTERHTWNPKLDQEPCGNGVSVSCFSWHCHKNYTSERCENLSNDSKISPHRIHNYCESHPCLNGANCTSHETGYQCHCTEKFYGSQCEHEKTQAHLYKITSYKRAKADCHTQETALPKVFQTIILHSIRFKGMFMSRDWLLV